MKQAQRITPEEFVFLAIQRLPEPGKSTIHTVFSNFNQAFRQYFGPDSDPVAVVNKMRDDGKIAFRIAKGGAIIGMPGSIKHQSTAGESLDKMGLS